MDGHVTTRHSKKTARTGNLRVLRKISIIRFLTLIYARKTSLDRQESPIFSTASAETLRDGARAYTYRRRTALALIPPHFRSPRETAYRRSLPYLWRVDFSRAAAGENLLTTCRLGVSGRVAADTPRGLSREAIHNRRDACRPRQQVIHGFPPGGNRGCVRVTSLVSWLCPEDSGRHRPPWACSPKMTMV